MYKRGGKRCLDLIIAGTGLIILFPLFVFIALILFFSDFTNPFFLQLRPGLNGKIFKIIKFRTMTAPHTKKTDLQSDVERITRIGNILRRTSLDEIPQLWNVIKGDMSLVGPRPLLPEYMPLYNHVHKQRHNLKPGITGWAQINGRNAITWKEKLDLDVWYTKHVSLALDISIIAKTVLKLCRCVILNSPETQIPDKFRGSV
jgi:undecaprenyl phosphate N,N'-diacetylbacillosamine 1-phosphate transferase